jgi:maltose alpha-D-glucosyltransferase/alpha-amylase
MSDIARHPEWYRDAIIYEVHVRAFQDSNGDGIGDFPGLERRLDYLQELGVTALWLLPFYPSPLRDDGYDIADYRDVHAAYGTLDDFGRFLEAAHARGLHVITELVINHTSDQHAWFQRARRAPPGDPARDFYVWSETPTPYQDARIIFQDFERSNWTWDPVANAYFWHRFYSHQPDLNFDNPAVHEAIFAVLDFWLGMGVDGLRLDAVPYLYEREGTNCENLPETHAFLKKLRAHVDRLFPNRMLLAEANQWPEDAVAYFGDGDECHMNFHFPLMPRLYMAMAQEDRFSLVDILEQTPPLPAGCQWATFLRNHDELTLEMVTDEERLAMLRSYAAQPRARVNLGIRRRLAPLMQNHRPRTELMLGLLLSLPGTPVLYYGDEIGMGDNIYLGDRDAVRTPMQWSSDRNAGFSLSNPQQLFLPLVIDPEYHYTSVNVEVQQANPTSLLWHTRRVLGLRRRHPALGRGRLSFLEVDNRKVLAFLRQTDDEDLLVVANLARSPQSAELDLSAFAGFTPTELAGPTPFPPIGELPYHLSLAPYAYYWFRLDPIDRDPPWVLERAAPPPRWELERFDWADLLGRGGEERWSRTLGHFLERQRWFVEAPVRAVRVLDILPLDGAIRLLVLEVSTDRGEQRLVLPLALARGAQVEEARTQRSPVVAYLHADLGDGADECALFDPTTLPEFAEAVLSLLAEPRTCRGQRGELRVRALPGDDVAVRRSAQPRQTLRAFQPDAPVTRVQVDGLYEIALYRRLGTGGDTADELASVATSARLPLVATQLGGIYWRDADAAEAHTVALVSDHVQAPSNAREWLHDEAMRFFEGEVTRTGFAPAHLPDHAQRGRAERQDDIGPTLAALRSLGGDLAALHMTLADAGGEAGALAFSQLYQRSLYQDFRTTARRALDALERARANLPAALARRAQALVEQEQGLLDALDDVVGERLQAARIRVHGDLSLARLRWTGHSFVLAELAGSLDAPASEQRLLRSPIFDLAALVADVERVAAGAGAALDERGIDRLLDLDAVRRFWVATLVEGLSSAYREAIAAHPEHARLIPGDDTAFRTLLRAFVLRRLLADLERSLRLDPPAFDPVGERLEAIVEWLPDWSHDPAPRRG